MSTPPTPTGRYYNPCPQIRCSPQRKPSHPTHFQVFKSPTNHCEICPTFIACHSQYYITPSITPPPGWCLSFPSDMTFLQIPPPSILDRQLNCIVSEGVSCSTLCSAFLLHSHHSCRQRTKGQPERGATNIFVLRHRRHN